MSNNVAFALLLAHLVSRRVSGININTSYLYNQRQQQQQPPRPPTPIRSIYTTIEEVKDDDPTEEKDNISISNDNTTSTATRDTSERKSNDSNSSAVHHAASDGDNDDDIEVPNSSNNNNNSRPSGLSPDPYIDDKKKQREERRRASRKRKQRHPRDNRHERFKKGKTNSSGPGINESSRDREGDKEDEGEKEGEYSVRRELEPLYIKENILELLMQNEIELTKPTGCKHLTGKCQDVIRQCGMWKEENARFVSDYIYEGTLDNNDGNQDDIQVHRELREKMEKWARQLEHVHSITMQTHAVRIPTSASYTLSGAVCLSYLYLIDVHSAQFIPRNAIKMSYLSAIENVRSSDLQDYFSPIYRFCEPKRRILDYYDLSEVLTERHGLFGGGCVALAESPTISTEVYVLLHIADRCYSELIQSLSYMGKWNGKDLLDQHKQKWKKWLDRIQVLFSYIVVRLGHNKRPHVIEICSRMLFTVKSQLSCVDLAQGRVCESAVTDSQLNSLLNIAKYYVKKPQRSRNISKFSALLFSCNLGASLREAFLFQYPRQARKVDSTSMVSSLFTTEFLTFIQRDFIDAKKADEHNPFSVMLKDPKSPSYDTLLFFIFADTFSNESSGYDWMEDHVVLPVDWCAEYRTALEPIEKKDVDLIGRLIRPKILPLLGRWVVLSHIKGSWIIHDCGTAIRAALQWLIIVIDHFDSKMIDGLGIPESLSKLVLSPPQPPQPPLSSLS